MRNVFLAAVATAALLSTSPAAAAASWVPPNNVRIVQKDGIDPPGERARVFASIPDALQSIRDARPDNRYLVKVMPGDYDLGAGHVEMKPFVDVEGSGPDVTILRAAPTGTTTLAGQCNLGTVVMANDSSIRRVKVINAAANAPAGYPVAIVFNGVSATAEFVEAIAELPEGADPAALAFRRIGICVQGSHLESPEEASTPAVPGIATLSHVHAAGYSLEGQGIGVYVAGNAHVNASDSQLVAETVTGGSANVINSRGPYGGSITLVRCELRGAAPQYAYGIWASGHRVAVSDSTIDLSSTEYNQVVHASAGIVMTNTRVSGDGPTYWSVDGPGKIATSQLAGDLSGLATARLFGNFTPELEEVPNQLPAP